MLLSKENMFLLYLIKNSVPFKSIILKLIKRQNLIIKYNFITLEDKDFVQIIPIKVY